MNFKIKFSFYVFFFKLTTNDEGFYSHDTSPVTKSYTSIDNENKVDLDDVWDKVLEFNLKPFYQWETKDWYVLGLRLNVRVRVWVKLNYIVNFLAISLLIIIILSVKLKTVTTTTTTRKSFL